MSTPSLVPLAGSARSSLPAAAAAGSVDPEEEIELTVITRRAATLPRDSEGVPVRLSLSELRESYSSDPADHALITDVLTRHEPALPVLSPHPPSRRPRLPLPPSPPPRPPR